jgi:DNA-binding response OmpR family regulator
MICDTLSVLLAEVDPGLRRALAEALGHAGHRVDAVGDGDGAVRLGACNAYDLAVLDVTMPRGDGLAVCRALRKIRPSLSVLMIADGADEVVRLREPCAGADHWIVRPFPPREILSHVRSLRQRAVSAAITPDLLDVDGLHLDLARCAAFRGGRSTPLTPREVAILRWLYNHRTRAVSRPELLEEVWGVPGDLQTRTVDMTISNLRAKIERIPSAPCIVLTVKGVGYAWGGEA